MEDVATEPADPPEDEIKEPYRPEIEIVRATTRFEIDLRLLSPVPKKKVDDGYENSQKRVVSLEERTARQLLERVSFMATTARNTGMRALFARDSALFDAFVLKNNGRMPRGKADLEYPVAYSYATIRKAVPGLASGIASAVTREVDKKWVSERYSILNLQSQGIPFYRVGQPFPIRAQDVTWTWGDGHAVAALQLLSKEEPNYRVRLPIEARDAYQRTILQRLASGEWRAGEVRIERDRLRPMKWYLKVAYKRKVPQRVFGQAAVVAFGMRYLVVALTEDGQRWIWEGDEVEAHLRRMQSRRQSRQRQVRSSGRIGHGRPRALKSIEHLAGCSERWRQNRIQVAMRRLASWLRERGVNRAWVGDMTGIRDSLPESLSNGTESKKRFVWERIQSWPYFQTKLALKSALEAPLLHEPQEGIPMLDQEVVGDSMHCPQCHYEHPENRDLRGWRFTCRNPDKNVRGKIGCGFSRHLDLAQAQNMLLRSKGDPALRTAPGTPAMDPEPKGRDVTSRLGRNQRGG